MRIAMIIKMKYTKIYLTNKVIEKSTKLKTENIH